MSSMLFLALLIVLVSGLIAYIGDLIGRKMGRKRLTLFGLRPRHTAIVISVGMGMLIAALTLIATFAVSQGVRDAFFTPLSELREKLTAQKQALQYTERELNDTRRRSQRILGQLEKETHKLNDANKRLSLAVTQRGEVQARLQRSRRELASIQQQLRDRQQQLRDNQRKLAENERRLAVVNRDLTASRAQLEATGRQLVATGQQLLEVKAELDIQTAARDAFLRMNFAPLAFASGQEILSGVIPARGSDVTRKALLRKFFAVAERIVRRQCTDLPADDAAIIFLRVVDNRLVRITAEEAVSALSDRIADAGEAPETILRFTPANNVPVNGQAYLAVDSVEIIPNAPAYRAGDEIARITLDVNGTTAAAEVLTQVVDDLLRVRVPAALREKGVVMVLWRFDPQHPDAAPQASWSMMPWSQLLTAVEDARAQRGRVSIVARSRVNANRFGPLNLALDVQPARSP